MPPIRSGRASKACDHCRRNKTRCYSGIGAGNTCLRCHTLSLPCSLEKHLKAGPFQSPPETQNEFEINDKNSSSNKKSSTDESYDRLERLERTVVMLMDRLDAQSKDQGNLAAHTASPRVEEPVTPSELNPAPVILIRDAADDAGVASKERSASQLGYPSDVISAGLITMPTAHSLLKLWV
ncbi:hypothetical protein N7478_007471 [Penicillium angulare]|uniref:uncharacterized protein n=1 Tax=Penicillium angulare TaxID=116970 RepID=UPI00253FB939|nr:uncharacterized protein N7478_007471 [Penicillium angulare]KAJ5272346.1 hypothetical protein N7478_007471 [Penicillium angulare]